MNFEVGDRVRITTSRFRGSAMRNPHPGEEGVIVRIDQRRSNSYAEVDVGRGEWLVDLDCLEAPEPPPEPVSDEEVEEVLASIKESNKRLNQGQEV